MATEQRLGVCYYPEHWPESRWAEDARGMVEIGLQLVRWANSPGRDWSPAMGVMIFEWLRRAIDTFHGAGLDIVLERPPRRRPNGSSTKCLICCAGRQGPAPQIRIAPPLLLQSRWYARECDRIVALWWRASEHPGVKAWQTDNEIRLS